MTPEKKAKKLVSKFRDYSFCDFDINWGFDDSSGKENAKECALICVKNEYHSLREMLFNLRACRVIESERVYSHRLNQLITEEEIVKIEINKL